jgi:succinate dehydrogenase / fumarate reductase cytochrome b subunit
MLLTRIFTSTVGKKAIMAITGAGMVLYIILHVLGNLQVLESAQAINDYAAGLHAHAGLLWTVRVLLITGLVLHVWAAYSLAARNASAHGFRGETKSVGANLSSRTMIYTGTIILAFIVFHLLHFTLGVINPEAFFERNGFHDVYAMVTTAFHDYGMATIYLIAVVLVGLHMRHGIASMLRSTGLSGPRSAGPTDKTAIALATLLTLGFAAVVVFILAGVTK